ncbi:dephospho-CoA kinase [Aureococcus anophagefferens]|nr:dephospho-CoA kinase [Aureococcus anophagefferens]
MKIVGLTGGIACGKSTLPGVVDADGCLDRGKLGSLIFNDAAQRRKLNVLMRGHILRAMGLELLGHFLAGTRLVVLDAPLLFETAGLSSICASYVVVGTSSDQQLARLVERDGCDEAAEGEDQRADALAAKLQRAHVPVMNLGTVGELEDQLERTVAPALWRRANLWWFLSLPGLFVLWVLVFRGAFLYMLATCLASEEMKCFTDFLDGADANPEPGEA